MEDKNIVFRAKIWKSGTGLVITIPQIFIKSGLIDKNDVVTVEIQKEKKR